MILFKSPSRRNGGPRGYSILKVSGMLSIYSTLLYPLKEAITIYCKLYFKLSFKFSFATVNAVTSLDQS